MTLLLKAQVAKCNLTNHERIDINIISESFYDDNINIKDKIMQYALINDTWIDTEAMNIVTDEQTINILNMIR